MNNFDALTHIGSATLLNTTISTATTTAPTYIFDKGLRAYLSNGNKGAVKGVISQILKVSLEISAFANGSFYFLVQESKDGITYTDVTDDNLFAYDFSGSPIPSDVNYNSNYGKLIVSNQETALTISANGIVEIGVACERYLKVSVVSTGGTVNAKALVSVSWENANQ